MLFKIKDLKNFLFSMHKQKIKSINIRSRHLSLSINSGIKHNQHTGNRFVEDQAAHEKKIKIKPRINTINTTESSNQGQDLYFTIVSPMIGTFYRSPAPNDSPFISVNDAVKANQTVCIIEAMKLMNEIESEVNGSIAEILVEDGDIVDCGQALMRVKEKQN